MSAALECVSPQRLLWDALVLPSSQAEDAWRRWRASTDLNHLDNACFHLLPALAGRMPAWLGNDPQQSILLGICRRAWSQNQVRKKPLADALEILRAAGIERVAATGPVLWGELYWPEGAIRPVGRVDLLIEPASVRAAFEALVKSGWISEYGLPTTAGRPFYFGNGVPLRSPEGAEVRVHWRALPHTDVLLWRPQAAPLQALPAGQIATFAIPAEYALVAALGGEYEDELSWRYDAIMFCRRPSLNWKLVAALLRRRSAARNRLDELRYHWGAEIPPEVTMQPAWTRGLNLTLALALRVYRRAKAMTKSV
jgi:hypothetical protein